jgi:plasmid stabilization system protein ParE
MTPWNLDFHPRAIDEARAARRWYARRSTALANQFVAELDDAIRQIAAAPAQWPPHVHGTRVFRLHRFPYLIIFRHGQTFVQVVAVAHGSRKPGYWRRRVP